MPPRRRIKAFSCGDREEQGHDRQRVRNWQAWFGNVASVQVADGPSFTAQNLPLLRVFPAPGLAVSVVTSAMPGPLAGGPQLHYKMSVAGGGSVCFDMQFLGDGLSRDAAYAATANVWQEKLAPAAQT